jgi:hypothetical protein
MHTFRQHFSNHNEVAKADKFDVMISVPALVANGVTNYDLSLQCEVSELPSRDITMIEFRHYAFIKRIPHFNAYGQATFTFLCTGDMIEKKLFDRWLDVMVPVNTGLVSYPIVNHNPVYEADIQCNQYDQTGNLIYTVNLISAIPIAVGQLQQSWQDDSPHRLTVTFAFLKWTSTETNFTGTTDSGVSTGAQVSSGSTTDGVNNYTNATGGPPQDQRVPSTPEPSFPAPDLSGATLPNLGT